MTETSGSPRVRFEAAWPMAVSAADRGEKSAMKKRREPAVCRHSRSLYFFAIDLGSISPAKKTTAVVTKVPAVTAEMPHLRVTSTVTMAATVMCTMLVPMRTVGIALSKLSKTNSAPLAL